MRSVVRRDGIILTVYVLLALLLTYPLVFNITTHGPGSGVDDPAQTWSLWWVRFALFDLGANPLHSDYVFYPLGINLAAYTPTFLNGVLSIPLQFAFGVVLAQNLVVYFSLVASAYGAYLFVSEILAPAERPARLGGYPCIAAAIAGALFGFGAWHVNYVVAGHFMLLSNQWIPFYALYLGRMHKRGWRNGALAGVFLALTAWTELTFALFLTILTGVYLIGRGRYKTCEVFGNLTGLIAVTALGTSPLALNLIQDTLRYGYYLASGVGQIQVFSAEPISFLVPSAQHPILGEWANGITTAQTAYAFVGYAALILAAIGLYAQRKHSAARLWSGLAMFFALLMLGSTLIIGGESTGIPMPFAALRAIPFVNANRYPVRFNVLLMLALVPLVAFGARQLLRERRRGALVGLVLLLLFEQLVLPIPLADLRVPPTYETVRAEAGDFTLLELPLGWRGSIAMMGKLDDKAQFYQTFHAKRLLGGITSRVPPFKFQYFRELPVINSLIALEEGREVDEARLARDRAAAAELVRFFDIRFVSVNRALTEPQVLRYAMDVFPLTEIARDETRTLYRVARPQPLSRINVGAESARLYFDDTWGRVQAWSDDIQYRWATHADSALWLPLPRADTLLTFRMLGAREGQKISVRVNGEALAEITAAREWKGYAIPVPARVTREGLSEVRFQTEPLPLGATRVEDYVIGGTGVVAPVDISVTGAGFYAGRFGEIFVAGKNAISNGRGYHLVAIDPRSGTIERAASFDTFGDKGASTRLAQFIEALPDGAIVAGAAVDDVSQNLQLEAVQALRRLGVEGDLRYDFRAGHAFIGVKGATPSQAVEQVDGRFPANVVVGKNIASDRVAFALAEIIVGPVEPASKY